MEKLAICSRVLFDKDILDKMDEVSELRKEVSKLRKELKSYKTPKVLYSDMDEWFAHRKIALESIKDGINNCINDVDAVMGMGAWDAQGSLGGVIEEALTNLTGNEEWSKIQAGNITYGIIGFFHAFEAADIGEILYGTLDAEQIANMVYKNIEWQLDDNTHDPCLIGNIPQYECPTCSKIVERWHWVEGGGGQEMCIDCYEKIER